jgi:hypothetical protein
MKLVSGMTVGGPLDCNAFSTRIKQHRKGEGVPILGIEPVIPTYI